jgi:hypothetical protein
VATTNVTGVHDWQPNRQAQELLGKGGVTGKIVLVCNRSIGAGAT